jgi:hypothetical protein
MAIPYLWQFLAKAPARYPLRALLSHLSLAHDMAAKKHKNKRFPSRNLDEYPRLETVLMVEEALYKYKSDKTIRQIWLALPEKTKWPIYTAILDYLEHSGKIIVESDRTVSWIWAPEKVRKLFANPKLVVR